MVKTIFDDISETNIVSGKRKPVKEPSPNDDAGSSPPNEENEDTPIAPAQNLTPNEAITSRLEQIGENMLKGFQIMKTSLENFGENMAEQIGEKIEFFHFI